MFIKTENEEYLIHKNLSLIIPKKFEEEVNKKFKITDSTIKKIPNSIPRSISTYQIKKIISNTEHLTLGVTENCNLRYGYCIYSSKYDFFRTHNPKKMEVETYLKAINFFFQHINSPLRSSRNAIAIGFYGGEPLLEFRNIIRATKYAKVLHSKSSRKFPIRLSITTNGILLNRDIVKQLMEQDFLIDISLDGPKEEHDIFRVKNNGSGSFDEIIFNIKNIKKNYPNYYKNRVRYYSTIHPFHNIKRMEEFFLSENDLFNEKNVNFAYIYMKDLIKDFHDSWSEESLKQKKQIENDLDKNKWFYKKLINGWLNHLFTSPTLKISERISFTGSCTPAIERIFVDAEGFIHICERINPHFPIGHVESGFDLKKIKKIIKNWNEEILKAKCWECIGWWVCSNCMANCANANGFEINTEGCLEFTKSLKKSFEEFISILEIEDEIKNHNCYNNINNYLESL